MIVFALLAAFLAAEHAGAFFEAREDNSSSSGLTIPLQGVVSITFPLLATPYLRGIVGSRPSIVCGTGGQCIVPQRFRAFQPDRYRDSVLPNTLERVFGRSWSKRNDTSYCS